MVTTNPLACRIETAFELNSPTTRGTVTSWTLRHAEPFYHTIVSGAISLAP